MRPHGSVSGFRDRSGKICSCLCSRSPLFKTLILSKGIVKILYKFESMWQQELPEGGIRQHPAALGMLYPDSFYHSIAISYPAMITLQTRSILNQNTAGENKEISLILD